MLHFAARGPSACSHRRIRFYEKLLFQRSARTVGSNGRPIAPTDRADRCRADRPLEPTDRAVRRGADRTRRRTCKISRSKIARRFRARLSQRGTKPTGDFVSADFTPSSARSVGSTAPSAVGRLGHGRLVRRRSSRSAGSAAVGRIPWSCQRIH